MENIITATPQFYELRRVWPEGYASFTLREVVGANATHLWVYKGRCGQEFLDDFEIVRFNSGQLPDLLPNNFGWSIASPRFCAALKGVDAEVKAFMQPIAEMRFPKCPKAVKDYALISAPRILGCLDLTSPALHWFDSSRTFLQSFESLRFVREQIPSGISFFGVEKVCVHVVSREVRDSLLKANVTGVSFWECELK